MGQSMLVGQRLGVTKAFSSIDFLAGVAVRLFFRR